MTGPVRLDSHQLHRFYAGGSRIAALRGIPSTDDHAPEDWVGSTTTLFGEERLGLSVLPDGTLLRDAVIADPEGWLGPVHVRRFGADSALLVKLLDAGERLPVHCHPDGAFARRHLGCPYGKTEAWIIVETRGDAVVHLGFTRDVDAQELAGWVRRQDSDAMLAAMHTVGVRPGDAVLVPAGLPHAIGEGVLLVELQEPTDLSVLLEWDGFEVDGTTDGHLGLGFDVALGCVDRSGWGRQALAELRGPTLPSAADPFFRAERLDGPTTLDTGFSIVVVLDGEGTLGDVPVRGGETLVVPHAAGDLAVRGHLSALRCRPPEPAT